MQKIFPYFTYAGALPFVFCAFCLSIDIQQLPLFGSIESILSAYALVIASFMAGAHWGQHLHVEEPWQRNLPIYSNVIAVLLWLGYLSLSFNMLMVMLVIVFVALLLIDFRLFQSGLITQHYFQTRCFVSAIVITSLVISEVAS